MRLTDIITFLLFIILSFGVNGQTKGFFMDSDRTSLEENETFQLIIRLDNLDAENIKLGDISPFSIVGGPSVSSSYSMINGKTSSSKTYIYLLQAQREGTFIIPSATASFAGKMIKTNDLKIKVTESVTEPWTDEAEKKSFVRLELSASEGYLGQVIQMDYVLYTRQNIERFDISEVTYPDGFFVENIRHQREPTQRKMIQGKEFVRVVLRKDRLFALKAGRYNIGPVNVSIEIPVDNGRSSFFFRETRTENIVAPGLDIRILPLPVPAPSSFTGAVGSFTMSTSVKKSTVLTGEAIILSIDIEGVGDPKLLKAPHQNWPEFLESYPPTIVNEQVFERGGQGFLKKTFEYFVVSQTDTVFTFFPEMTYFDPEYKAYQTIKGDSVTVTVVKGAAKNTDVSQVGIWSPVISSTTPLLSIDRNFWSPARFLWAISGMVLLTILSIFLKKKWAQHKERNERKNQMPFIKARESLGKAYDHMKNGDKENFFHEIVLATTGLIMEDLNIVASEAEVNVILGKLLDRHSNTEIVQLYENLYHKVELARFARVTPSSMEEVYTDTDRFLTLYKNTSGSEF